VTGLFVNRQLLSLSPVLLFCIFMPERMNDGVTAKNKGNAARKHHKNNSRRF
jgi:hypothetical protein